MNGKMILVGGGARSGKSTFALNTALAAAPERCFIATAQAFDDEMRERIARHQAERGQDFRTVEAPLELSGAIEAATEAVVLVDCLTLWLSNLLIADWSDEAVEKAIDELISVAARRERTVILVTNEVGLGIVPTSALGRRFRDLAGRAHQRLAAEADEVYLAVMGMRLRLRPPPIEVV